MHSFINLRVNWVRCPHHGMMSQDDTAVTKSGQVPSNGLCCTGLLRRLGLSLVCRMRALVSWLGQPGGWTTQQRQEGSLAPYPNTEQYPSHRQGPPPWFPSPRGPHEKLQEAEGEAKRD